jgi:hypothetical protein
LRIFCQSRRGAEMKTECVRNNRLH